MFRIHTFVFTAVVLVLPAAASLHAAPLILEWTEQLGTDSDDWGLGVSADSLGNVYISGLTYGSLGGPNAGQSDAFVAKYDASGALQWTEQLGTANWDESYGVSADSLGNVYISGLTYGSLGGPNAGTNDTFLAKYDAAGALQWIEQLGTGSPDASYGVSADLAGNVYISGSTEGSLGGPNAGGIDAFVAKYAIPEPSSGTLALLGLAALSFLAARRRRSS